ncbi:hypothetical protein BH11MYX2_BH11MYX2_21160 [soil metagenome]
MALADATRELYQAPLAQFVDVRKRLAGELKAAGDKPGATTLGKLAKPPVSAWAVNQLYWHSRAAMDRLFTAAGHLRTGDMRANGEHRESLAALRKLAAKLLEDAGHTANESTLRRINMTLSALAAAGTWEPDEPGQLAADRDPPGFDALGALAGLPLQSKAAPHDERAERRAKTAEHEAAEKEHAAQKKRDALAKLKKELEHRLEAAQKNVDSAERQIAKLAEELSEADDQLVKARENVEEIESQLASLE